MIDDFISTLRAAEIESTTTAEAARAAGERELFELLTRATLDGVPPKSETRLQKVIAAAHLDADTLAAYVSEIREYVAQLDVADGEDVARAVLEDARAKLSAHEADSAAFAATRKAELAARMTSPFNQWNVGQADEHMKETAAEKGRRDRVADELRAAMLTANRQRTDAATARAAVDAFRRRRPALTAVIDHYRQAVTA